MSDLDRATVRARRRYSVARTPQYVYLLAGDHLYVTENPCMEGECLRVIY